MHSYKSLYKRYLAANTNKSHFACHSHHYWPDITREAVINYWEDSAKMVDDKWEHIFGTMVPQTQTFIADILNTGEPEQIVFAPNTHELLFRLLTCFQPGEPLKILTTDSEFYSFSRQVARMNELSNIEVTYISTSPFHSFESRFIHELKQQSYDLVFFSQVFFNSGMAINDLSAIVEQVPNTDTMIVIDGYHGFMALPTDLSAIKDRVFYLSGSYKYAQAGEGCCFMHVPKSCQLRPIYTGWFAEFGELADEKQGRVQYSKDGNRFAGATMDYSALYKLHSVLELFNNEGIRVADIHQHVQALQAKFLKSLEDLNHPQINSDRLVHHNLEYHGHFLTFELDSAAEVKRTAEWLREQEIFTDYRGNRLRFGFAMYQDLQDCDLKRLLNHSDSA